MIETLLSNLVSAPVLFFVLGVLACLIKSDLDIPQPIPKLLSLYLLISIGLKGGVELGAAEASFEVAAGLGAGVLLSALIPIWTFFLLRPRLGSTDAAGIAATYGSISAVTFIIAASFLESRQAAYGGHMVAAMALMESPAIIVGILMANKFADRSKPTEPIKPRPPIRWGTLLHESAFNSAVLLLLGSMVIGLMVGKAGFAEVAPFVAEPFKGVLCLFLLDMGLLAARRLGDLRRAGVWTIGYALAAPPTHAALGIALAYVLGLSPGDALLLAMLAGSGSYIAVPAALRLSLPRANPSLYVPMALGITFPFNVIVGIPLAWAVIQQVWPATG
jgi:hypothetical protein